MNNSDKDFAVLHQEDADFYADRAMHLRDNGRPRPAKLYQVLAAKSASYARRIMGLEAAE